MFMFTEIPVWPAPATAGVKLQTPLETVIGEGRTPLTDAALKV